jgi:hypothetical protein
MIFPVSVIIFPGISTTGGLRFPPLSPGLAVSHPPPDLAWLTEKVFPATVMFPFLVFVDGLLGTEYESVADPVPVLDPVPGWFYFSEPQQEGGQKRKGVTGPVVTGQPPPGGVGFRVWRLSTSEF